jgi:hypothetical protein
MAEHRACAHQHDRHRRQAQPMDSNQRQQRAFRNIEQQREQKRPKAAFAPDIAELLSMPSHSAAASRSPAQMRRVA